MDDLIKKLQEPFAAKRIKWRPGPTNERARRNNSNLTPQAIALPYIDARDVMWRLDRAAGAFNWQTNIKNQGGVMLKGIGIKNPDTREWTWRWEPGAIDGADESKRSILGAASVALRRAGAEWGIGRYLYHIPRTWVGYNPQTKKLTEIPALPKWALPYDLQNGEGNNRPEEITEAGEDVGENPENGTKHSGPYREPAKTLDTATRPLEPEYLRQSLAMKAKKHARGNCTVEQLGLATGMVEMCFAGDQASTEKRRSVYEYLFGVDSGSNLRNGEILALLDWLNPTKDSGNAYTPDPMAVKEAQAIIRVTMIESGQKELPI